MKRKSMFWLGLLVVGLLAVGGYMYYTNGPAASAQAQEDETVQTSPVRTGSITVSAAGAGTVIPAQEIELGFATGGTLTELAVQVGDSVAAGDVLAHIDDTDAQQALVAAQLQLAQAQMQTDASVTQTGISYDDISVAQAQMTLDEAQAALDELVNFVADEDEIALLEAQLASAQAGYNAARGQEAAGSTSISIEQISLDQTVRSLTEAQAAYDTAYDPGRDWELNDPRTADSLELERDRAADALLRAQEALEVAQLSFNATVASTNSSSSTSAESNLLAAQQALEAARSGPTADDLSAAETAVRQAELALQQAQLNREANALSLQQAQLTLQTAEEAVAATSLTAPIDGVVTTINAGVGETTSGTLLIVADLTTPLLEVYLDESDLNMVGVGYETDVTFDALPDQTFTGTVLRVDPTLTASNGVSVVRALVRLNADSFAKPQTLPAGLNATVEVIGGRAENALIVPVEALREISDGQYAVFVLVDGQPELRLVEVGLMDYSFAEIVSGLSAGETVTTGLIETDSAASEPVTTTNQEFAAPPVGGGEFVAPPGN